MKTVKASSEKGQSLVLIVLSLVVLMGFISLALDGGAVYSNRRSAQNAADSAAYAGAASIAKTVKQMTTKTFDCTGITTNTTAAITAAQNSATSNNYTIDANLTNKNGVQISCTPGSDPYVDVHVQVSSPVQTALMQFVNSGQVVNTVDSVVRVYPKVVLGEGETIIALRNSCGNSSPHAYNGGLTFNGSYNVKLTGGGAHSNSCVLLNGINGTLTGSISYTPPGTTDWNSGMTGVSQPTSSACLNLYPQITTLADKVKQQCDTLTTWGPDADNQGDYKAGGGADTIQPGKYRDITITKNNADITFAPGLYCITGTTKMNSGIITGNNVTFYVYAKDNGTYKTVGDFDTTGGPQISLAAPLSDCGDPFSVGCSGAVGGTLLLFMSSDNTSLYTGGAPQVLLGGNSSSFYGGAVVAPYTRVNFGGDPSLKNTSADTINHLTVQIIADTVWIHGNVNVDINYNVNDLPSWPAKLRLNQ